MTQVGRNEWFEIAVTNSRDYGDPYIDVDLSAVLTSPAGESIRFWGFYDGDATWRLRWMPRKIGRWTYEIEFSDGAPLTHTPDGGDRSLRSDFGTASPASRMSGKFECVPSQSPGLICRYGQNPMWFSLGGETPIVLRSFHAGDRFFASNWDASARTRFLDWVQDRGYNTLSIGSFLLNRDAVGRGRGWLTPRLWPLSAGEYRAVESILDQLAKRRIVVFPFAGFFGRSAWFPTELRSQVAYIKYVSARLGAYWNLLYNVAGPEPLLRVNPFMWKSELDKLGYLIRRYDPYGHLITIHNETGPNAFVHEEFIDFVTLQGPKTIDRRALGRQVLRQRLEGRPLYAQETLWPGNTLGHPRYTIDDIRKNAFVLQMCGATVNFADCEGNSSSGFTGSLDPGDAHEQWHDEIKKVWDLLDDLSIVELSPDPKVAGGRLCLSNGRRFIVYVDNDDGADSVVLAAPGGFYTGDWIDATGASDRRSASAEGPDPEFSVPGKGEWLLCVEKADAASD